jgi:hypothetical protein
LATAKVPRRSAASELEGALDSPEIERLIERIDATRWTGRPGYPTRALLGACIVKALYALPTWARVARLIDEHDGLARALGERPSVFACYRFAAKLRRHGDLVDRCIDEVITALRGHHPDLGQHIAIDGSDMPAWANGMRYVSKGGPERERFSDPDASWGHRSAISTRKGGGFYGYKLHAAVCTETGLPIAWHVESARNHEASFAVDLVERARARGAAAETCAMDKGYDINALHDAIEEIDCAPLIPLRNTPGVKRGDHLLPYEGPPTRLHPRIPRGTEEWKSRFRKRVAIEREFGRLKHEWALLPLRVRGRDRVAMHADLTILARLTRALTREREG